MIGRVRRRARRFSPASARGNVDAVRRALRAGTVQAKLRVGAQNDAYEREADTVAAQVMEGDQAAVPAPTGAMPVQRMCADCEEEAGQRADVRRQSRDDEKQDEEIQAKARPEGLQRQPAADEEEEEVQAKARQDGQASGPSASDGSAAAATTSGPGFIAGHGVASQVSALRGAGQPLPVTDRAFFEPRFGADFSDIRVHTGPRADAAAGALNARAFTTGRDVVFGHGEYTPGTRKGRELLAHELTHVIQQRGYKRVPEGAAEEGAPVQRWAIGAGPVPRADWSVVPQDPAGEDHRSRLGAAENIVRGVLASRRCVNFFRDNCGLGEGGAALQNAFNQAQVYFIDRDSNLLGEQAGTSRNIAYGRRAFRIGRFLMAGTLLHEMFHTCDPTFDARDEIDADTAVETCRLYVPFILSLSTTSGSVGDRVTITGIHFGGQSPSVQVLFGGVPANVISRSFVTSPRLSDVQTIVSEVPAGATTGDLEVVNHQVRSNGRRFTVV